MRATTGLLVLFSICGVVATSHASLLFDQSVSPDVIFGDGVTNGSFTVDNSSGLVELGLRAKLRFDENNDPQNIFNSNGDGSYSFNAGSPTGGAPWVASTTPIWNFEWTANVDYEASATEGIGWDLDDLTYRLGINFDPAFGDEDYVVFDPINLPDVPAGFFWDNAIGDHTTGNGGGVQATSRTEYASLIAGNNVAQNSWNMEFFNEAPFPAFDPNAVGEYKFYFAAADPDENDVAYTEMTVLIGTPEPGSMTILLGIGGLAALALRRRKKHGPTKA